MSNFSFSRSVFYLFRDFSAIVIKLKLSSAKYFSLGESKICCLGKGYHTVQNFHNAMVAVFSILLAITVFYFSNGNFQLFFFHDCHLQMLSYMNQPIDKEFRTSLIPILKNLSKF